MLHIPTRCLAVDTNKRKKGGKSYFEFQNCKIYKCKMSLYDNYDSSNM